MNRTTSRLMIAAAAVVVATGVASAQAVKAEIPFTFRVGNAVYAPGTYRVEVQDAGKRIWLHGAQKGPGTVVLAISTQSAPKEARENGAPTLSFACGLGRCQLVQVWSGDELPVINVPHPKASHDEAATMRVIHTARSNGD